MDHTHSDEWLERAFRLAYFLHGDRKTASEISARALNKLRLAATAQGKRLYYRLTGRTEDARKARSKISLSEPHLLQRLVYVESEDYELRKERAAIDSHSQSNISRATTSDLVVYFIKHLVRITTKRNSFYVTLGLSRLLYNYTTPETMELYNLVIQDPDRVHDDYYYRSRKGLLLKELKIRFGALLEVTKGARGEQRWRPNESADQYAELARECLVWFTPWETPCVVPQRFDPLNETINLLNSSGRHPEEEHEVEVNRLHAALHPECFARLTAASGFAAPDERLELPHFLVADNHDDSGGSSRTPPTFSADDLRAIDELLAQEAMRRKAASASFFRVLVDGRERAEIHMKQSASAHLQVDESAEIIEVYCEDQTGPLLLATHLLNLENAGAQTSAITIEGGQQFSFTTKLLRDEAGDITGAELIVTCKESATLPAVVLAGLERLVSFKEISSTWWKPAAAFGLLALLCIGAWWLSSRNEKPRNQIARVEATPSPTEEPKPSPTQSQISPTPSPTKPSSKSFTATPQVAERNTKRERDENFVESRIVPDADVDQNASEAGVRNGSWNRDVMGKPLDEVQRVYVQAVTDNVASQNLLTELQTQLTGKEKLQFAKSEDADAALKISVRSATNRAADERVIAIVRVVNANGYVVWPVSRRGSSMRYKGRPSAVAERIVTDLTKSVVESKRRR